MEIIRPCLSLGDRFLDKIAYIIEVYSNSYINTHTDS